MSVSKMKSRGTLNLGVAFQRARQVWLVGNEEEVVSNYLNWNYLDYLNKKHGFIIEYCGS